MRRCLSSPSRYASGASLRIGRSAAIATLARFCGFAAMCRCRCATMTGLFAVTMSPYGVSATGGGSTFSSTADELARAADTGSGSRPRAIEDDGVGKVVDVVPSEANAESVRAKMTGPAAATRSLLLIAAGAYGSQSAMGGKCVGAKAVLGRGGIGPRRDVVGRSSEAMRATLSGNGVCGGGGGLKSIAVAGCRGGSAGRVVIEFRRADTERVDDRADVNTPSGSVASPMFSRLSTERSSSTWSPAK